MKHKTIDRLIALLLVVATLTGMLVIPAEAATISAGETTLLTSTSVTIKRVSRGEYLAKSTGGSYGGGYWQYTSNNGITGTAYCVNWGLNAVSSSKRLPLQKYDRSPKTMGAFANGYPQRDLEQFKQLHEGKIRGLENLTEDEYRYATQVAIWATCGQLAVPGTAFTAGRSSVVEPTSDAQKIRIFDSVKEILRLANTWTQTLHTGLAIRAEVDKDIRAVEVVNEDGLQGAAADGTDGIKKETINGKEYYTRVMYVASATSTWIDDYKTKVYTIDSPSGTIITAPDGSELEVVQQNGVTCYLVDTSSKQTTNLNANGSEYRGTFKVCIPADNVADEGSFTVKTMGAVAQYQLFLAKNSSSSEQSYIVADPAYGLFDAKAELSWKRLTEDDSASLQVNKTGPGGEPLEGAEFTLTGSNGTVVTGTSDANGEVIWNNLPAGETFVLEETSAPAGFSIAASQNITLTAGKTTYAIVKNDSHKGFIVKKIDKQNGAVIEGAVFRFEQIDGSYVTTGTTGFDGMISFEGDELPFGSYRVSEERAPTGYELDTSVQTVKWDGTKDVILTFQDVREPTLVLSKVDGLTGISLPGATFKVYKDGKLIDTVTTNDAGEVRIPIVAGEGYYEIEEFVAPEGFVLDSTRHGIHIDPYDPQTQDDPVLTVKNYSGPVLKIAKVEEGDAGTPIPNTVFRVEAIDGDYREDVTTGADGFAILQVVPGSFRITEISVPDPYCLPEDEADRVQTVSLNPGEEKTIIFKNSKQPLLKISKVEKGTDTKIPGTVFLLEAVDSDYRQNVTTGADGSVELRVKPGSYRITEQSVPEPYVVGSVRTKTISLNPGDEKEVIFENLKKPELTLYKIDADSGDPIPGTVLRVEAINGDYQDDWKTGADGTVTKRVEPGTYRVTEISVPAPYYLPDKDADRVQTVSLNAGDVKKLTFKNRKAPKLTIYKEDSVAGAPVEGAKFHVTYTSNGEAAEAPATIDFGYIFTDARGEIKLHEQGKRLYPGEYTITEVAPAPGFQMKEPTTQTVIIHGNESKTVTFQNEPLNAVIVEKYDSVTGEALPGCTFQLKFLGGTSGSGGTVIGQKVTGKNGTAIWTGLKSGTYILEEIDPADGYSIINSSETVYISDNGTQSVVTVKFDNSPDGFLLIRKVCSVNPSITLANAEFKITYADGTLIGDSNGIYRTDENGEIRITGLKPGKSVIATEVKAPPGFLIDTQSQTIQIKEGRTVTLTFKNQPTGKLIIQKRDSITGDPLPGAQFRITTAAGCEVGLDGVIGTATLTQNGIFTTDSNGEIRISNLAPGALILTEIRAPSGYVIDNPSTNVVIGTNGDTQTVVITNTPKGGLLIRKIDSVTGDTLSGVKFKITTANGELVPDNEGLTSSNGIYTTDENGQIYLRKLNPNTYIVTEVETLDGYLLDAAPQTVVVSEADTQVLTFINMPLGGLLVKKMDSATKEPLVDVIFKITRTDGTVVGNSNGEYRTDERGFISLPDLKPGSYIVREVQAKIGYLLDDTPHTVAIKDHQTYTLEVFNQPLGNLIINKLSSLDNSPLEGVKFQIKYANGQVVDNKNGQVSSNGIYYTDRNGQIILSGITGSIVVTELESIPGYRIDPNTRTQTLVVNPNDTQTINFYNTPTTTLIIRKFIEGTENEPLSGVAFRVVDGAGAAVGPDDGLYYTDKSGEIVLTGIEPGTTVIAREVKTVDGFVLDGTPQDIKIEAGHVQQLTFWNKRAGTLVIQKKDKVSGALIAGAEFQLTYANGGYVDNDNGHLSSNGIYKTDDKGEIRVSGVVGTIVAKETKAAPGYVIDQTTQTQTVTVNPMDTQTLTFLNDPLCSLTLTKLDSVTGKPVPNTEFTVKDGDGNVLGRYVTGSGGNAVVTGLIPGSTVVVSESRVPSGYVLDTTPKTIIVKNGSGNSFTSGTVTGGNSTSGSNSTNSGNTSNGNGLTFENDPKMTLTIHKYIEGTANEPLAGVAFKVMDGSGKPLNPDGGIYYTNNAGEIVLEGLEPGTTITAQEIKTVDGYVLDGRPQSIKIEAGKSQNLTFWNKPAGSLIIRKLDKLTGKPLAGVEFELVYAKGGYVDTDNGHLSSKGLYTTDDHGEIHISGITGTVVVKETRPLSGYTIEPGRETQTVTVNPQETQTLTFYNIPANTLTIQKYIDGTDNTPLAGVEFLVTDSSGAVVGSNNGYFTTDKDGCISIPGLTPGTTITAKETKTLDGFILDSKPQSILIKEGEAQSLTFWNKKAGGLIVNKIDAITKEPLAGVKFKITYADGSNVDMDGGKISSNGIYTTDSTGQIKILGIVGTVIVEEIETIPGYIIDPNTKSQTVKVNANDTQTLTFANQPTQTLVIQKLAAGSKDLPLAGVEFLITDSSGAFVGNNNGIFKTDEQGRITLTDLKPGTVITAKETKTLEGYVLDSTPKSMEIKSGEVQTLTFYNTPVGGLELIKVNAADKTQRIPNTTFEIRKMDGALVDTVTTGDNGRVHVDLDAGSYYAVEIEAAKGFQVDSTPHYFTVEDGKTATLTVTNKAFSGILIHKIDSATKEGIYGVTFLLYDSNKTPIGQYTSDDSGYAYINDLPASGRYYLRELENEGYIVDTQLKTVYVTDGATTEITWENTAVTGQIQIAKTSADYNSMNGWPAGTPIPNTEFEIYHYRTGNLVDTIRTDKNGVAASKPLPLGRYKIVESKAADFYGLDKTPIEVEIEYAGQIVKAAMTNKALYTNVSIKKTGYTEVMPGQQIRYDFSGIANNSTTALTSFYWRDTLPSAVRLAKIVTGTYNVQGNYKIVFKTNLNSEYRTMYDNLSTQQNNELDASPVALGLASNEYVTEIMFSFGVVPGNFRQVEAPKVYCNVVSWLTGGAQFANQADVGGVYNGQWIMAATRWVTKVYKPSKPLPRTGY